MPLCFFEDISEIPRESGHEEKIREFLDEWAKGLCLESETDSVGNLIIRKPGSKGRETEEPVIMQAHMDMVCEKVPESSHDFRKDPIELLIDGDMLRANGTTLGADDGIGVALIMAVLADDSLSCPPIEALITVEEETTFKGAAGADPKYFKSRRIINLDHAVEHQVLAGSCGGEACAVRMPVAYEKAPGSGKAFKLSVSGLHGGHSGEDIHRGYGSAIQLLIRSLRCLLNHVPGVKIASIEGGTNRLAISRDAGAVVIVPDDKVPEYEKRVSRHSEMFTKEYIVASPGIKIESAEADITNECLDDGSARKIVNMMSLCPDGLQKMNGAVPGVVESSLNVGEMRIKDGKFEIVTEIRGAFGTTVKDIEHKLDTLAKVFSGETEVHDKHSAWPFDPDSKLRKKAIEVYKDLYGEDLDPIVVHAGIECGLFMDSFGDIDAISLGPDCWSFHSPDEHTAISSVKREWRFIKELLKTL